MKRYNYVCMDAKAVNGILMKPAPEDSFVTQDAASVMLHGLLAHGYQWIRTDGDVAVFERVTEGPTGPETR